jgi:hypothetical protein
MCVCERESVRRFDYGEERRASLTAERASRPLHPRRILLNFLEHDGIAVFPPSSPLHTPLHTPTHPPHPRRILLDVFEHDGVAVLKAVRAVGQPAFGADLDGRVEPEAAGAEGVEGGLCTVKTFERVCVCEREKVCAWE